MDATGTRTPFCRATKTRRSCSWRVLGRNDRALGRLQVQAQVAARFTKRCVARWSERRGSLCERAAGGRAGGDASGWCAKGLRPREDDGSFVRRARSRSTAGLGWRGCGRFGMPSCRLWPLTDLAQGAPLAHSLFRTVERMRIQPASGCETRGLRPDTACPELPVDSDTPSTVRQLSLTTCHGPAWGCLRLLELPCPTATLSSLGPSSHHGWHANADCGENTIVASGAE
jgi:hypothetical protein